MNIPAFICTKCGKHNDALESNLLTRQTGKDSHGENLVYRIRSISRECSKCGKQKIITGVRD